MALLFSEKKKNPQLLLYVYFISSLLSFLFSRLGSSMAQLSVVPVRWTHPQAVPHLDSHSAPGYIQKVGVVFTLNLLLWSMVIVSLLCPSTLSPAGCGSA